MKQTRLHSCVLVVQSTGQVHGRPSACNVFASGLVCDLSKEVPKEYPNKLRAAIRLAQKACGTVQFWSSMDTPTTAGNEKNEQARVTTPTETDASNSRANQISASDERRPLLASHLAQRREASDERGLIARRRP